MSMKVKQVKQIREYCREQLINDPFECYEEGVFIIKYKMNDGHEETKWHGNRRDADAHYDELIKNELVMDVVKDYRVFNKEVI